MSSQHKYHQIPIGLGSTTRPQRYTGSWSTFKPSIDSEKCTKCGLCIIYCPDAVIEMTDEGPEADYDFCKGCGICANECPVSAITMERVELEE